MPENNDGQQSIVAIQNAPDGWIIPPQILIRLGLAEQQRTTGCNVSLLEKTEDEIAALRRVLVVDKKQEGI